MGLRKAHLLFLIIAFLVTLKVAYGEDETEESPLKTELEALRREIAQLRTNMEALNERLDHFQKIHGMGRYRFPRAVELFGESIPLERRDIWERMDREFMIAVDDVSQVLLWMKRANRYFPFIERRLKSARLPDDLKYVAIVESALRSTARSPVGALGLWQFMPATGERYGLQKTPWVDERLDPVQSTYAAIAYLKDLYSMFGNWLLAVASYNCGEDRVERTLKRQRVVRFYDLVLPAETERYIFRIASAKVILSDPQAYGFEVGPEGLYHPMELEPVTASIKGGDLDLIAMTGACGMTYRDFLQNNRHLTSSTLPRGRYTFYLPPEKREVALNFINDRSKVAVREQPGAFDEGGDKIVHRVEPGETLSDIAKKYGVLMKSIMEWNSLSNPDRIHAGQRLVIYQ